VTRAPTVRRDRREGTTEKGYSERLGENTLIGSLRGARKKRSTILPRPPFGTELTRPWGTRMQNPAQAVWGCGEGKEGREKGGWGRGGRVKCMGSGFRF